MRKPIQSAAIAVAAAVVASALVLSNARVADAQRPGAPGGTNNGPYYVVQIINPPEETTGRGAQPGQPPNPYDVLDGKQIKDKQKELEKKYQDNYEKWQDEKKIDPKAVRPKKPSIKRLKTFKTKEVADEYKQKLEEELAKKEGDKPKP